MIKFIGPDAQTIDQPRLTQVKVASDGLHGNDLKSLIKNASHEFADCARKMHFAPGDVPVHLIAMGATEMFGNNRNGDGFKAQTCRTYHPTFVKHAKFYRSHENKNPAKSYGFVKKSFFNEDMQRIELLAVLNENQKAADRNGGLVADKEMQKLASGANLAVSMACFVTHDICSGCGNKAKTRDDYCTGPEEGGFCKRGGVRNNMCKVCEDGHVLHVDNPDPKFFDISHVFRPADRIAYVLGKAASCEYSGSEAGMDSGIRAPLDVLAEFIPDYRIAAQLRLLPKLAAMEDHIRNDPHLGKTAAAFSSVVRPFRQWRQPDLTPTQSLSAMAGQAICMSPAEFFSFHNAQDFQKIAALVTPVLPSVFASVIEDDNVVEMIENNHWTIREKAGAAEQRRIAEFSEDYSLRKSSIQKRASVARIYTPWKPVTLAKSADANTWMLAKSYALYKLAFLEAHESDPDFDDLCYAAIAQNFCAA